MERIYTIFNRKLPDSLQDLLPGPGNVITFLNPYSLYKANEKPELYQEFSYIASDGILPLMLQRIFGIRKSQRYSFDMSGIAGQVFTYAAQNHLKIYFIGSRREQIDQFIGLLTTAYPSLSVAGWRDGYIKGEEEKSCQTILACNPDIVIVGMGTPLQDEFAIRLKHMSFKGTIYTCGGFMHQATQKLEYFPPWINKLHLRAFYRLYKEPYVRRRILLYYPKFIFQYSWFLLKKRKSLK